MVNMIEVESSNVKAIGYDEPTRKVFVEFLNGNTYAYLDVDKSTFEKFLAAESKGKYVRLLNEGYKFTRIK